ncbi:MAG: transglycosylase SLT domain-containing protein, partial [Ornithinimicrobium sp.]|uniref:lytic transglycosylase domain-containing protein n=1 Tax=Ornithinimicrobium sp. TaxID=1977084 RepID=UPI0026DEF0FF
SVTVRAGDTLSGIALRHGTTVSAVAAANGINAGSFIYAGQKLRLPGGGVASSGSSSASGSSNAAPTGKLDRPYDESNIGSYKAGEKVPDTFLHYHYSSGVARSAAANREYLAAVDVPSRAEMKNLIAASAKKHGVDSKLMLALSYQESGWNHRAVSPANAIGAMQVIPSSGQWASSLVGRQLNLLEPKDNAEAGVVIIKALLSSASSRDHAIGGYYQGLASVRQYGLFADTKRYVSNIKYLMTTI